MLLVAEAKLKRDMTLFKKEREREKKKLFLGKHSAPAEKELNTSDLKTDQFNCVTLKIEFKKVN